MSRPSNSMVPSVGSISLSIVRPAVLLPQPLSPTRPTVSPASTWRLIPLTAFTSPTCFLSTPAVMGNQVRRSSTRRSGSVDFSLMTRPRVAASASVAICRRWLGVRWQRTSWSSVVGSSSGRSVSQRLPGHLFVVRAPRAEDAALRQGDQRRRAARDRVEPAALLEVQTRDRGEQAERVGHLRAGRRCRGSVSAPRCGRRT